jgi:serine/threonine protein kinase
MIDPKRSKYRRKTEKYFKDSIFDIIDIQEGLEKNKLISKANEEDFIYNCIGRYSLSNKSSIEEKSYNMNTSDDIINRINQNRFGFRIENLELEYKNGYIIKLIDKYTPIDIIGEGAFSTVISAFDNTRNCIIAIKIIVKQFNQQVEKYDSFLENETKIQLKLDHPRIVKLYEVVDNQDYLFMFIEYMQGGTLKDLIIERFNNADQHLFQDHECAKIIQGVTEALNYMHNKNIMHRDIKPENILFKDKNDLSSIKLGDFGLATFNMEKESKKCGTLLYMAPEVMNKKSYDATIDIWATGFILFIMLSGGRHPIYTREMDSELYITEVLKEAQWNFPTNFPLYLIYFKF